MDPQCQFFRINGVVTNMKPFYDAFNVTSNQALYKNEDEIASVW